MRKIFLIILAALILNFSTTFAAEVWKLPEHGIKLEDAEKQNYIREKMNAIFHPAPDSKPATINFEVPDGWNYEKFELDGLPCEVLENPDAKTDRVVLQLHGGGYVLPLRNGHRNLAIKQSVLAEAKQTFLVDYRVAPENIFPAAQEDAVKIYKEILRRGISPEKIIVIGDSAGGNLALALSVALKEKNIPQPKMLILISAWGTVEKNLPSRKLNENRDLVLGKNYSPLYNEVNKYSSYAKNFNKKNPNLSPIYADFTGFPTMLIQAGGYELLADDSIEIAKKAAVADVKFTLTIYPQMPHDFALMLPDLQDSLDSFREIQDFINQNME